MKMETSPEEISKCNCYALDGTHTPFLYQGIFRKSGAVGGVLTSQLGIFRAYMISIWLRIKR